MPPSDHNTVQRRLLSLSKEYDQKLREVERVEQKRDTTIDPSNQVRYRDEVRNLWEEIENIEKEMRLLEQRATPDHQRLFQEHFHKINFREAMEILDRLISRSSMDFLAALFLIQQSTSMGGEWCVQRIREHLASKTVNFRELNINLPSYDLIDKRRLIELLANAFHVEERPTDDQLLQANIIRHLHSSFRNGSILFVAIHNWEALQPQEEFLRWLLKEFWGPLVAGLPAVAQRARQIKVVFVITASTKIMSRDLRSSFFCTTSRPEPEKIIELPLRHWTIDDIRRWLDAYSGLDAAQVDRIAPRIYSASKNGYPSLVHKALVDYLGHPAGE